MKKCEDQQNVHPINKRAEVDLVKKCPNCFLVNFPPIPWISASLIRIPSQDIIIDLEETSTYDEPCRAHFKDNRCEYSTRETKDSEQDD